MKIRPVALHLVTTLIFTGIQAFGQSDEIQEIPSQIDYLSDSASFESDLSNQLPRIQDYPNNDRQKFIKSISSQNDSLASPLDFHRFFQFPVSRKTQSASANSQEFLDHVSIIARIANGISLQSGLMNNEIDIEDVAGELLNFGIVPVSTIAKFNPEAVNEFTTKLTEIPNALDSSILKRENTVLAWTELRRSSQAVGNVTDLPGKEKYFSYLKSLKFSDFDLLAAPGSLMREEKRIIGELKSWSARQHPKITANNIVKLLNNFEQFFNSIEPFRKSLETLKSSELMNGPKVFEPIEKTIELMFKRVNSPGLLDDVGRKTAVSNLKSLTILSVDSKYSTHDVNALTSLSKTKSNLQFQKRKVTGGFLNGFPDVKQLARDFRNPWIEKIIGIDGSLDSLNDGLIPLLKMNKRLDQLDEKLEIFSSRHLFQSLSSIQKVQKELSKVDPEIEKIIETVWVGLENCIDGYNIKVSVNSLARIQGVIKTVKNLTQVSQFKLDEFNFDEIKTKVDNFIEYLDFKIFNHWDESAKQVPQVLERLEGSEELDKIEKTVDNLIDMFDDFKDFETKVKEVVSKENTPTPQQVTNEQNRLYRCLEKVQNTDKVADAISVGQYLRSPKNDEVTAVKLAIAAISRASKDLSNLGRLTTEMKKYPDVVPTDLNKFPDSASQSKVISQSAASLQFAHDLKELDPEISHLKTVDSIVQAEILKVSDQVARDKLAAQWGDNNSDMDSLDKTLSAILSFESLLDVSKAKTLEELGNPLKNLGTIPDVKINALEKSKVLEFLTAQPQIDPIAKSELEWAKKTLDKLVSLDLGFASHKSEFEKAPNAFKALQDFLVGFLKNKQKSFRRHRKVPFDIGRDGQRGM